MRKDGWTAWEVDHVARHGVTPQEVEELLAPPHVVVPAGPGVRSVSGRTLGGRLLVAIVADSLRGDGAFVVTARDMSPAEARAYRRAERKGTST